MPDHPDDWNYGPNDWLKDLIVVNPRTGEVIRNSDGKILDVLTQEELKQVVPKQYQYPPASE
jgi:hypothetical protein